MARYNIELQDYLNGQKIGPLRKMEVQVNRVPRIGECTQRGDTITEIVNVEVIEEVELKETTIKA